jgi:folate-binding protein YgfZ
MTGDDRKDLLHRLTSNDVNGLEPGRGCRTLLLERSGRLVDRLVLTDRGDELLLLGTRIRAPEVIAAIDRFTILEDARIEDATEATREILVTGEEAAGAVERATGARLHALERYSCVRGTLLESIVVRIEDHAAPAFAIVAPKDAAGSVLEGLGEAAPGSDDELRALRVWSGIASWGAEIDERTIPLETRLVDAISFTKGCYVGQEVIARLHHQRRVKRSLCRVEIGGPTEPVAGAALQHGENAVGRITSAAVFGERCIALAILDASLDTPGTKLSLVDGPVQRPVEVLTLHPEGDPRWRA